MRKAALMVGAAALTALALGAGSSGPAPAPVRPSGRRRSSGGGGGTARRVAAPSTYAAAKVERLRPRFEGPLGAALGVMIPADGSPFRGAPVSGLLGFTAIGGEDEDTCSAAAWRARPESFHEIGEWQTPAGPCSGPAPNPDPDAEMNHWGRLATSSMVRAWLGRDAVTAPGAWRGAAATRDRAAVGLADLYSERLALLGELPGALAPRDPGGIWAVALAFAAFSAGPAGAAQALAPVEDELARVDESRRFAAWPEALVELYRAGRRWGPRAAHPNPAYTCARTWQKIAAGKALADAVRESSASWYVMPSPALERELVLAAEGAT